MLIELNGLHFHLRIASAGPAGASEASIVDEAFDYDIMKRPVVGPACVCKLIEDYTGFTPTPSIIARISTRMPQNQARAA